MSLNDEAETKSDIVLERLNRLHPKIIDLGLERVHDLLARLGNPEQMLPPVVHVAGTNGKGSVIAYLRAMLEAAGKSVHCYTSPHLVRFHERIRLNGSLIEEEVLVRLLENCEAANDGRTITYFEITTIAALLAFSRAPSDILLLETGLGGRLDATNVVAHPTATVITPVSLDHTQFLGETIREIAFEKAGILKPGCVAVVGKQSPEALSVIEQRAAELGSPLYRFGQEWHSRREGDALIFEDAEGTLRLPKPRLLGAHQFENAGLAIATARRLGSLEPDGKSLAAGLKSVEWPARLQRLSQGPLVELLSSQSDAAWELWLDGGHNEAAGVRLSESLADMTDAPLHLIYGMMNTKAADRYLQPLAVLSSSLRAVTIPDEINALSAGEAASVARSVGFSASACPSVREALCDILHKQQSGRILICGSLYLAGHILGDHK